MLIARKNTQIGDTALFESEPNPSPAGAPKPNPNVPTETLTQPITSAKSRTLALDGFKVKGLSRRNLTENDRT